MADDLPYKAEYAKSGRSSCKLCKSNISKDILRVAKMVQVGNLFGKSCLSWRIRSILSRQISAVMSCDQICTDWVSLTCYYFVIFQSPHFDGKVRKIVLL